MSGRNGFGRPVASFETRLEFGEALLGEDTRSESVIRRWFGSEVEVWSSLSPTVFSSP